MIEHHARVVLLLARAELEIALIDRTRPLGVAAELQRLLAAWHGGRPESPLLRYAPGRSLGQLRRALEALVEQGEGIGADAAWLLERARELLLEAQMAEAVGTVRFGALASERFAQPRGPVAEELESTARGWIGEGAAATGCEHKFRSDDHNVSQSLCSVLSRRLVELHLPIALRVDPELMSVAACGENSIAVRSGAWLTERAAERITEHEITGHLLPRIAARSRTDILRCGCAGSTDDEEGRALLIEQRLGLMDPWRRAELGARHLACAYLRRGATFVDAVRCLIELGAPIDTAIGAMLRASRGGGLGREIIYLRGMRRLARAFEARPELEDWFRVGRASLRYALRRKSITQAA